MKTKLLNLALALAIAAAFVWQRWTLELEALELAEASVRYGWIHATTGETLADTLRYHAGTMQKHGKE